MKSGHLMSFAVADDKPQQACVPQSGPQSLPPSRDNQEKETLLQCALFPRMSVTASPCRTKIRLISKTQLRKWVAAEQFLFLLLLHRDCQRIWTQYLSTRVMQNPSLDHLMCFWDSIVCTCKIVKNASNRLLGASLQHSRTVWQWIQQLF